MEQFGEPMTEIISISKIDGLNPMWGIFFINIMGKRITERISREKDYLNKLAGRIS